MGGSIRFESRVRASQRRALEALVFFNRCQERVAEGIVDAVKHFGPPEIVIEEQHLRVRVAGLPEAQSLFAVDPESGEPLGVAVFVRADFEHVTVLHLGVREDFAAGGPRAQEQLLLRLLKELRRSSLRVKGVRHVELFYGSSRSSARSRAVGRRVG
jgi:hypothetical protein